MHADYFRDARPLREMGAPALRSALRDATRRGAARGRDRHIVNSRLLLLLLLLNPTIDAATNSPRRSHLIVSDAYGTRNIPLLFRSAPPFTGSVPVRFAFESTQRDSTRLDSTSFQGFVPATRPSPLVSWRLLEHSVLYRTAQLQ